MGIYFSPVQEKIIITNENDIRHLCKALKPQGSDMQFARDF